MLHVLRLAYTGSAEEAEPHVREHVDYLERHHASGAFLVSGQTAPPSDGGVIIARGDRAAVEEITGQDPFVRAGVGAYSVTTLDPGRVHPALAGLLDAG
ncbi:YciI family protein [Streptomonospora wellingtoniae]|uniref:YciI family protein n=1 Tax=Streptomonospora wellingtoniae TaxID=3075544 RepID=A0ABU2KVH4_9ACTN|nr:YciI family protein [Streptomonospora sp. DSM 45055]MDT0303191.1 YciI family protein [Streptomonospora sp. DSM 45055]